MKRYRPFAPGFIVLYVLTLLTLGDVIYTIVRQVKGVNNDLMGSFSFFSYLIFAMACCYTWMYVRAEVVIDGQRCAWPSRQTSGPSRASPGRCSSTGRATWT